MNHSDFSLSNFETDCGLYSEILIHQECSFQSCESMREREGGRHQTFHKAWSEPHWSTGHQITSSSPIRNNHLSLVLSLVLARWFVTVHSRRDYFGERSLISLLLSDHQSKWILSLMKEVSPPSIIPKPGVLPGRYPGPPRWWATIDFMKMTVRNNHVARKGTGSNQWLMSSWEDNNNWLSKGEWRSEHKQSTLLRSTNLFYFGRYFYIFGLCAKIEETTPSL